MAMIACPECKKEISNKAPACPSCGAVAVPAKKKTSTLTWIILGLFVLGGIGAIFGDKEPSGPRTQTSLKAMASEPNITREAYNQISDGMTAGQVKAILGEPRSVSESAGPTGKMEMWHFQKTFGTSAVDITLIGGKVYQKNFTQL